MQMSGENVTFLRSNQAGFYLDFAMWARQAEWAMRSPNNTCLLTRRHYLFPCLLCIFSLACASASLAAVDAAVSQTVWKMLYAVTDAQFNSAFWHTLDDDGDGVSNAGELAAGTNPFAANSTINVTSVNFDGTGTHLAFPTTNGKLYILQSTNTPAVASSWANLSPGVQVLGDGASKTLTAPPGGAAKFFRVMVEDTDTDGDGLSDWAEKTIGYNPESSASNGSANDYTIVAGVSGVLARENIVTIMADNTTATMPPDAMSPATDQASITITRSGVLHFNSITVPLVKSGTALEGSDYDNLPNSITFPPQVNSISLTVNPRANANMHTNITASVKAMPGGGYTVGGPDTASVVIYPAVIPNGTGLTAKYYVGANPTFNSPVNFGGNSVSYSYTKNTATTGTATITYFGTPGFSTSFPNNRVNLQFSSGSLIGGAYDKIYIIANTPLSTTFTVDITGANVPNSGLGNALLNPPVITRVDPQVDNSWSYGLPNGRQIASPDNFSVQWETYLSPATAGDYVFFLDADDKARVFLNRNDGNGSQQILENGWNSAATGGYNQSAALSLAVPAAPGDRYHIRIEFVDTTGAAKCKFHWKLNDGTNANISAFTNNTGTTSGWSANYYNNTTFTAPAAITNVEQYGPATIAQGDWGTGTPDVNLVYPDYFCVRWSGQVLPQFSEKYYFVARADDGVRLTVNNQLIVNRWANAGGGVVDTTGSIDLQAGVLYDIVMEYYEAVGDAQAQLHWYSQNQPKQLIPTNRLYPESTQTNAVVAAPTAVTSPLTAVALAGDSSPFTYIITASNGPDTTFTATGLPAWLTLNTTTGVITGSPSAAQAGHYQIVVTATNAAGTGSSVVNIDVIHAGSQITREIWTTGVSGSEIADIPVNTAPSSIDTDLSSLEDGTAYPDNTGERLRGYIIAPVTGNYYFWLAANNSAELWISNNAEPINKIRRAFVNGSAMLPKAWDDGSQSSRKSQWLALTAGQKYYYEILHNCPAGSAADHVAVGWLRDLTGTSAPIADGSAVVPGFVLAPYDYPATVANTGTLFATNLAPQGSAISKGSGSANIRLNAGKTQAVLHFNYSGLTTPRTGYHVHCDAFSNGSDIHPGQIVFDIDDIDIFHPELRTADGGYIWDITAVGTLSAADVVTAIETGKVYINIHSVNYPSGEIRGNFSLVQGSQSPPSPVTDPGYIDDHDTEAGAARFLLQATYGVDPVDLANVRSMGYAAWIDSQFALSPSRLVPEVLSNSPGGGYGGGYPDYHMWNAWWKTSITAPDQLRQRVAFALSEILVVSNNAPMPLNNNGLMLAGYYDTLLDHSFTSNFSDILKAVTLSPAMGVYLDMRGNQKGSLITGLHPNENYARELMQLFSIGLNRMWPDGTLMLDSMGNLIPTYTQTEIIGISRVFTGWNYGQALQTNGRLPTNFFPPPNYLDPMVLVPTRHELGEKRVLDNVVLPPANAAEAPESVAFSPIITPAPNSEADPNWTAFDNYCLNDLEKGIDSIMSNPNIGPYICRQLIQRLVTSHPSNGYVGRVVQKFNDDGTASHVRGNMKAVIKAILLDGEARDSAAAQSSTAFGKQREPLLRLTGLARTFPAATGNSTYNVRKTDELSQTPLNSPTVFNFFFPDYKYPGTLGNAGLTTPEFQLTNDISIVDMTNSIARSLIGPSGNNTNTSGLCSFPNGGGAITMNLGPYQTPAYTSNAGIPSLVDKLSNLLLGGPMNADARTVIINFVANTTNFPYTTVAPTDTEMRDRVRAVVHLIVTSAGYSIQK